METAPVSVGRTTPAELPPGFRDAFLRLSSSLTGFDEVDLEGTGLVEQYAALFVTILDDATAVMFTAEVAALAMTDNRRDQHEALDAALASDVVGPLLANVITLWYLGAWQKLPDTFWAAVGRPRPNTDASHIPSSLAYEEGLAWRVACAHPPGARPTGYGGWGLAPVVPVRELPPIARGGRPVTNDRSEATR